MILASQARKKARESLAGNWSKAVAIALIFTGISLLLGFFNKIPYVGGLIVTILTLPLSYGILVTFIKLKRKETITYVSFLQDGFSRFKEIWFIALRILLKVLPWLILLVFSIVLLAFGIALNAILTSQMTLLIAIVGIVLYIVSLVILIIKAFSFVMVYYLLHDNPTLTAKEIVAKSQELMEGNKKRYFYLSLSFLGWALLCVLTLGIGYFFLLPYTQVTFVYFYEDLIENRDKKSEV